MTTRVELEFDDDDDARVFVNDLTHPTMSMAEVHKHGTRIRSTTVVPKTRRQLIGESVDRVVTFLAARERVPRRGSSVVNTVATIWDPKTTDIERLLVSDIAVLIVASRMVLESDLE